MYRKVNGTGYSSREAKEHDRLASLLGPEQETEYKGNAPPNGKPETPVGGPFNSN